MTPTVEDDNMVTEVKEKGLAVFSYDGFGLAINIDGHNIDTIFDIAKKSIKKQMENEDGGKEIQEGEEVRTEDEGFDSHTTEPVDGDTTTRGVPSEVHGPEKSDLR